MCPQLSYIVGEKYPHTRTRFYSSLYICLEQEHILQTSAAQQLVRPMVYFDILSRSSYKFCHSSIIKLILQGSFLSRRSHIWRSVMNEWA